MQGTIAALAASNYLLRLVLAPIFAAIPRPVGIERIRDWGTKSLMAETVRSLAHAAFQRVPDANFAPHPLHVDGATFVGEAQLMEAGVEFVAVDVPTANRLTVHILAAMAEHERSMISARTKAALAQAKARGVKLGGDRGNLPATARKASRISAAARGEAARKRAADPADVIADLRQHGATSLRQLAEGLNGREIATPRGGRWTAAAVSRVLQHVGG